MNELNIFKQESKELEYNKNDESRAVAEVQAALMSARMAPRDQGNAMNRILNACTRPSLAESSLYSYVKGGTDITGPSIRLAEMLAQQWGNMQFGIRELDSKNCQSIVQAFAWDIETNVRREITFTVPHVRYTKYGKKVLNDSRDIYETVANNGSRRLRACILAIIPGDVTEMAVKQCERTLTSNVDVSPENMEKLLKAFEEFGVSKEQIEKNVQRSIDAIKPAHVVKLKKIYSSLKDGMSVASDWFEAKKESSANKVLNKKIVQPEPSKAVEIDYTDVITAISETQKLSELSAITKQLNEQQREDLKINIDKKLKELGVK